MPPPPPTARKKVDEHSMAWIVPLCVSQRPFKVLHDCTSTRSCNSSSAPYCQLAKSNADTRPDETESWVLLTRLVIMGNRRRVLILEGSSKRSVQSVTSCRTRVDDACEPTGPICRWPARCSCPVYWIALVDPLPNAVFHVNYHYEWGHQN